MWNRSIILFILTISFVVSIPLMELTAQETDDVVLKWEPVPSALGYILEIRGSNKKVLESKRISVPSYELSGYPTGIYEHRVGVVNKFGKVESYTDWYKFEVVKTLVPVILSKNVFSAGVEEKTKTIEIKGKDYLPSMKVYLKKEGKIIYPIETDVKSSTLVTAKFKIEDLANVGMYDIVLENPKRKTALYSQNFILARDKEQAEKIATKRARIINNEVPSDYYDTPYWSTMWRSSIIPGWGQDYIDEARWKFYIYPVILFGSAAAYGSAYQDFLSARDSYNTTVQNGFLLNSIQPSETFFFFNNQNALNQYNAAKTKLNNIQIGAGLLGAFALYNIIDAFLSVRRNVVDSGTNPGISIPSSSWKLGANSAPRNIGVLEQSIRESYTNIELKYSF